MAAGEIEADCKTKRPGRAVPYRNNSQYYLSRRSFSDWSILTWLSVAGIPAVLYVIQSLATLLAYQNLDALTFNVLNQTKTLSAALCCYLVIGKKQSMRQIVALFIMLLSALIMEQVFNLDYLSMGSVEQKAEVTKVLQAQARRFSHGVIPVLLASFLSGLAGALCQKNLQNHGRNPYLFCMELCAASSIILTASLLVSPDGQVIKERGFWGDDWDYRIFIPIVTNAVGGILVGLVTKYAGSVRKGFALIFGILISGLLQSENVSAEQVIGGTLAAVSLYIHSSKGSSNSEIEQKQDTEATLPLVSNEMSSSKVPVKQTTK